MVTDQGGVPVSNYHKDPTIIEQIRLLLFPFFNYPILNYDQEKKSEKLGFFYSGTTSYFWKSSRYSSKAVVSLSMRLESL